MENNEYNTSLQIEEMGLIPIDVVLSDEHKAICDASPIEKILLYIFNPNEFIKNVYDSIVTFSWKI